MFWWLINFFEKKTRFSNSSVWVTRKICPEKKRYLCWLRLVKLQLNYLTLLPLSSTTPSLTIKFNIFLHFVSVLFPVLYAYVWFSSIGLMNITNSFFWGFEDKEWGDDSLKLSREDKIWANFLQTSLNLIFFLKKRWYLTGKSRYMDSRKIFLKKHLFEKCFIFLFCYCFVKLLFVFT